jgi:hypothetical protein
MANRICCTRDGDARSDQPRSGTAINAAVEVIGDRCWLPVLRDVMFGNTSATCRNDPKRESPRTSSPDHLRRLTADGLLTRRTPAAETVQWVADRVWWIGSTLAVCFALAVAASMWLEARSDRRGATWGAARHLLARRPDPALPDP